MIKVIWGRHWDQSGKRQKRTSELMDKVVDGELQNFKAKGGAYTRVKFLVKTRKF